MGAGRNAVVMRGAGERRTSAASPGAVADRRGRVVGNGGSSAPAVLARRAGAAARGRGAGRRRATSPSGRWPTGTRSQPGNQTRLRAANATPSRETAYRRAAVTSVPAVGRGRRRAGAAIIQISNRCNRYATEPNVITPSILSPCQDRRPRGGGSRRVPSHGVAADFAATARNIIPSGQFGGFPCPRARTRGADSRDALTPLFKQVTAPTCRPVQNPRASASLRRRGCPSPRHTPA